MPIDLTKRNHDFALYLPALWPPYVITASGRKPAQRQTDTRIFNFLDDQHSNFYYPYALYSAGHKPFEKADRHNQEAMVYGRNRNKTTIVTDSAGYQFITGKVIQWKNFRDRDQKREAILNWQIEAGDIGMIIDIPLACEHSRLQPSFNNFSDCLNQTVKNIRFFDTRKAFDRHPFMNVIHGRDEQECDDWYGAVKEWPLRGWAFGGDMKENFYLLLRQLIILRDNKELEKGEQDWIHLFGTGKTRDAIHFTQIKRQLRKHNPSLQVSFDTSTYSIIAGTSASTLTSVGPFSGDSVEQVKASTKDRPHVDYSELARKAKSSFRGFQEREDEWSEKVEYFEDTYAPFMEGMTYADLIVDWGAGDRGWDAVSYNYVMMLNLYLEIERIQGANVCFDKFGIYKNETADVKEMNRIIEEVFTSQAPMSVLAANRSELEAY